MQEKIITNLNNNLKCFIIIKKSHLLIVKKAIGFLLGGGGVNISLLVYL